MRKAPRLSAPSRSLTAASFTTTNSQFCALLPVGALSASSITRSTSPSSTGSGLSRRIARWVRIASSSGIEKSGAAVRGAGLVSSMLASSTRIKARPARGGNPPAGSSITRPMSLDLRAKVAVVGVGFEKMRDGGFARPNRSHPVLDFGERAPHVFALSAHRYFAQYGASKKTLAAVAVKNHKNGMKSPKAHLKMEVSEAMVLGAPMIYSPLGLFDCCPTTDGAAAVVVCRADLARSFTGMPEWPLGIGLR